MTIHKNFTPRSTTPQQQRGGTLLGIIIGIIIGLAIAFTVSLLMTKKNFSLTSKTGAQPMDAPSMGSSTSASITDPNTPLYGAKKEAPSNITTEPKPTTALTESQPEANDKWQYYVQTGAFRTPAEAQNNKAQLALLGFEVQISERASDNGTLYRVRIGPFSQTDAASAIQAKLTGNHIDTALIRIAK